MIYAFGSMLSCNLCERQKISESHKLKRFVARNQFRAARFVTILNEKLKRFGARNQLSAVSFVTILIVARSINIMELVVEN